MKITTRGRYAVMAMVSLAASSRGNPVPIQTIAKRESIPEPYLQQLFLRLRKQNIVKSVRGPGGGFILARDPAEITVGEIIRTAEGKPARVGCRFPLFQLVPPRVTPWYRVTLSPISDVSPITTPMP